MQRSWDCHTTLRRKIQNWCINLPWFQVFSWNYTNLWKTVVLVQKGADRQMEHDRVWILTHRHGKLTFDKSAKWKFSGESIAFSKIVAETTGYPCGKTKTLIYTLHHLRILTQKDLNINPKSIQLLEEYIPENLCDFGLSS